MSKVLEINVGDTVKSLDFPDTCREIEGKDACFIEGVVEVIGQFASLKFQSCDMYKIRCTKKVFSGKEIEKHEEFYYAPVNGTKKMFGSKLTDGVVKAQAVTFNSSIDIPLDKQKLKTMNRAELQKKAEAISKEVREDAGDMGSCVMGYELKLDGVKLISQPAQGSSTCEKVYSAVTEMLLEEGVTQDRIKINYGRMD